MFKSGREFDIPDLKERLRFSAFPVGKMKSWKIHPLMLKVGFLRDETFQSLLCKETLKALMVGGMIYYTYQEGLWSDAFRSSCFIGKFIEKCPKEEEEEDNEFADISNIVFEDPEPCQPFIPHSGVMLYRIGYVWNQVVIFVFWFVLDAPGEILEAFRAFCRGKPKPEPEIQCIQAPPPT